MEEKSLKNSEVELNERELGIFDSVDSAIQEAKKAFIYYRDTTFDFRKK